jgi:hypothetical protein
MKRSPFSHNRLGVTAAMLAVILVPTVIQAQSLSRLDQRANTDDQINAKAIEALKRLHDQVIVYRSLGEFEESGRLARVPLREFENELRDVTAELTPIVPQMPAGKFRNDIVNALASYRDGLFWWRKIDQPRVVHVSALRYDEEDGTAAHAAFLSNIPYTVAIHWRQAAQYLNRAENLIDGQGK